LYEKLIFYSCAAKHKSRAALRGDLALFKLLSKVSVYTTSLISTELVLTLGSKMLRVPSNRASIYHEINGSILKIYVPSQKRQKQSCYRSQLPKLLSGILRLDQTATFDISTIMESRLRDLEDMLVEQDIPPVDWIEKPVIDLKDFPEDDDTSTPTVSEADTLIGGMSRPFTPSNPVSRGRDQSNYYSPASYRPLHQYPKLIEQVTRCAERAGGKNIQPIEVACSRFNHEATFGSREADQIAHDRRIGAAGEAYVSLPFQLSLSAQANTFIAGVQITLCSSPIVLFRQLAQYNPWCFI
jgi:hypothetical protein